MDIYNKYISYVRDVKRYSERTVSIYTDVLNNFVRVAHGGADVTDDELIASLNPSEIRSYEVAMLDAGMSPRTVGLHLSALSGFCRYLVSKELLRSNPVKLVPKPKQQKRLPNFFRKEALEGYFNMTHDVVFDRSELEAFKQEPDTESGAQMYKKRLDRLIVSMLYGLGLRRSELIGMNVSDVDFGRKVVKVRGKGDKMREIPILDALCEEILLYLEAVEAMCGGKRSLKEPLLVTGRGQRLYPGYVDKAVKGELAGVKGITGKKSPHVLRHSLATGLLNEEADLNSIKELLGHSSLAATQVYTHNSIARLKGIYEQAHPRAKNGGKYGD